MMKPRAVLGLSGSLRCASTNTAMLTMAGACAPLAMRVTVYRGLGDLPLFNPDLDPGEALAVAGLQRAIAASDALLIASPEYAHGVSSAMKNALDWMVSTGVLVDKPVVLWNASPRASHALAALLETLTVMSARTVPQAALSLLIKATEAGLPQVNPDPRAMRHALLQLQQFLRSDVLTAAQRVPTASPRLHFPDMETAAKHRLPIC